VVVSWFGETLRGQTPSEALNRRFLNKRCEGVDFVPHLRGVNLPDLGAQVASSLRPVASTSLARQTQA
jgi:hypothetical protein